jgi:cold-inducible RNA-binding protein
MNIYVGNLSSTVSEDELRQAFEAFGQVESVSIIKDKFSGESRGFGFVVMPSREESLKAIEGMNNKDIGGKNIAVSEARPRVSKFRGGSGGGRGPGGGSRGGRRGGFGGDRREGNRRY